MPIWNRVKQELDRAGKAAQDALDEGKIRLEAFRTRQLADKAAQALGYAVYRARAAGGDLEAETYERLRETLSGHETEATRLEQQLEEIARTRRDRPGTDLTTTSGTPGSSDASASGGGAYTPPAEPPAAP